MSDVNKEETYFSLSPSHLDMRSEEETEKKVELFASVATALARYDFPVPGGPNSRMPLHGVRLPENRQMLGHTSVQVTHIQLLLCVLSGCEQIWRKQIHQYL